MREENWVINYLRKYFHSSFPPYLPNPTWILKPVRVAILFSFLKVIFFHVHLWVLMLKASRTSSILGDSFFSHFTPLSESHSCRGSVGYFSNSCVFQPIPEPKGGRLIQVEGYWISVGDKEPTIDETYILTSSVKLNLRDIVRVVSAGCVDLF